MNELVPLSWFLIKKNEFDPIFLLSVSHELACPLPCFDATQRPSPDASIMLLDLPPSGTVSQIYFY
jgi:hypothetical protein